MATNIDRLIVRTIASAKVAREAFVAAIATGNIANTLQWDGQTAIKDECKGALAAMLRRELEVGGEQLCVVRQFANNLRRELLEGRPWEHNSSSALTNVVEAYKASAKAEWLCSLEMAIAVTE